MKTFFQKKKVTEEPKKSQTTSQPKENPFLSGNENTTNPFTKSAPAQFAGLGGFMKAGKRLVNNLVGGKGIKNSINDVKSHNSEKKEQKDAGGNVDFYYVLKNPKLRKMFINFLEKEISLENLECYEEVERIKKNPIPQLFPSLYYQYLKRGSPNEINIPNSVVKSSDELIARIENNPLGESIDTQLLDAITTELKTNLYDSYSRFIFSPEYVNRHK